jgi:hypothetical protein
MGANAGGATTTGDFNVFMGENAGIANTTGNNNTCIGENANVASGNQDNSTALGKTAISLGDDRVRIGNTSVTDIRGHVSFSDDSDARFKRNVTANVPGLEFISRLNPVTYTWDIEALCRQIGEPLVPELADNRARASNIVHTGFLAQEVENAANEIGFNFSGVVSPENEKDTYALRYADFTVPLVKAVQEQQILIEQLRQELELQKAELELLKNKPKE